VPLEIVIKIEKMMELKLRVLKMGLVLELVIILTYVNAENKDNCIDERDPFYENLVKRMEFLEFRDRTRENENMELKQRVQALETLVTDQQSQISSLKETTEKHEDVNKELYDRVQYLESREKANGAFQNETKSHNKRIQVIEQFITNLTLGKGNKDEERSVNRDIQRS
jgi:predicted RNase H-like nuclease (RuvC/YqgF family)